MRDAAALGNVEVLPWDCWGAMPAPGATIRDDDLVLFDWVARYTQLADGAFDYLQRLRAEDERLRVPPVVRNALRNTDEAL